MKPEEEREVAELYLKPPVINCAACGKLFQPSRRSGGGRTDPRFCGNLCRSRSYYRKAMNKPVSDAEFKPMDRRRKRQKPRTVKIVVPLELSDRLERRASLAGQAPDELLTAIITRWLENTR